MNDQSRQRPVDAETNRISGRVIDAAMAIHRRFGPGLLESVYEDALAIELSARDLSVRRQVQVRLEHRGTELSAPLRLDVVVEQRVIVEVKAVTDLSGVHRAQLLTYLRFSGIRVGLLINFNSVLLKDGIRRMVL